MDIKKEAEQRYPDDYAREGDKFTSRRDFMAGAEWALRRAAIEMDEILFVQRTTLGMPTQDWLRAIEEGAAA